ncbi:MAG: VOC family protein [Gammaproteobacteria bacterium]|nr:VOC family protein [Gammaproteobacteria bacterium]
MIQPVNSIGQIAYITEDMDASLKHWTEALGVGPFFLLNSSEIEDLTYRGEATELDITAALAYNGHMCVEIIQQHDDVPSVYSEIMAKRGPGFHHWGYMTDRFEEDMTRFQSMGYPLAFAGEVKVGGKFAYMDSYDALGGMIELIDFPEKVKQLFEGLQAAAVDWDGSDPVRQT